MDCVTRFGLAPHSYAPQERERTRGGELCQDKGCSRYRSVPFCSPPPVHGINAVQCISNVDNTALASRGGRGYLHNISLCEYAPGRSGISEEIWQRLQKVHGGCAQNKCVTGDLPKTKPPIDLIEAISNQCAIIQCLPSPDLCFCFQCYKSLLFLSIISSQSQSSQEFFEGVG